MVVSGRMKIGENVEIVTATTPHGERRGVSQGRKSFRFDEIARFACFVAFCHLLQIYWGYYWRVVWVKQKVDCEKNLSEPIIARPINVSEGKWKQGKWKHEIEFQDLGRLGK